MGSWTAIAIVEMNGWKRYLHYNDSSGKLVGKAEMFIAISLGIMKKETIRCGLAGL